MSFKLRSRTGAFPPGGFQFKDPRTGLKFEHGDFKDVVSQIIKHRQANPRIYPKDFPESFDFNTVSNILDSYTCDRLKNSPKWCISGEPEPVDVSGLELMLLPSPCYKCHCNQGYEIICKSCAGRRRTGFYCRDCLTIIPK